MLGRGLSEDAGGLGVAAVMSILVGLGIGVLVCDTRRVCLSPQPDYICLLQFSNILTYVNIIKQLRCQRNDSESSLLVVHALTVWVSQNGNADLRFPPDSKVFEP